MTTRDFTRLKKKRGRPALPPGEKLIAYEIYLSPAMLAAWRAAFEHARDRHRSFGAFLREAIITGLASTPIERDR